MSHTSVDQEPYPAYKDSGVEWLGEIPVGWRSKRLKLLAADKPFAIVDGPFGTQLKAEDYVPQGIPVIRVGDLDYRGHLSTEALIYISEEKWQELRRSSIEPGDVVVAKTGATIGKSGIVPESMPRGLVASSCIKISPDTAEIIPAYLLHCLTSEGAQEQILLSSGGSTRDTINLAPFENLRFPCPSIAEQCAIATFLDRETARIDALVAKRERQIELLQEKRTALITQAVTKGLDPKVPMKDSGVKWLSAIPRTWAVKRLKYAVPAITVGIVVTPSKYYTNTGIPCFRSFNIADRRFDTTDLVFISPESNELHRKSQIHEGDVLVVRTGRTGTAAIVPKEFDGANCIDLLIVRRSEKLLPSFLWFLLNSGTSAAQIEAHSEGAIQAHYNTSTLAELLVPIPPVEEQEALIAFLDCETTKIDALVTQLRSAITLLQEYRTALISAAVTGKIDVRDAV